MSRISIPKNCSLDVRLCIQEIAAQLADYASPIFASFTLTNLTANTAIYADSNKTLTSFSAATNGQLFIGSTGTIPALATLTGTANQITVTNGAGSITLSTPQDIHTGATPTFGGIVVAGDGTIGQAAGPLLTFDDSNNYLGITGCNVGIGTVTPDGIVNTATSAAYGFINFDTYSIGAAYSLFLCRKSHNNTIETKTETVDGETLGLFGFKGVEGDGNFDYGAYITAVQDGTAEYSRVPTHLDFFTFAETTGGLALRLTKARDVEVPNDITISGITINNILQLNERSSDPSEPAEGKAVIWMSDGTGYGDDGDVCIAGKAGGVTKKLILFDHSAGDTW